VDKCPKNVDNFVDKMWKSARGTAEANVDNVDNVENWENWENWDRGWCSGADSSDDIEGEGE